MFHKNLKPIFMNGYTLTFVIGAGLIFCGNRISNDAILLSGYIVIVTIGAILGMNQPDGYKHDRVKSW